MRIACQRKENRTINNLQGTETSKLQCIHTCELLIYYLEFKVVPARIAEEHGHLLASATLETHMGFDDKLEYGIQGHKKRKAVPATFKRFRFSTVLIYYVHPSLFFQSRAKVSTK